MPGAITKVAGFRSTILHALRSFTGLDAADACFWPRWMFLRLLGVVLTVAFLGFCLEGQVLLGPHGLTSAAGFIDATLANADLPTRLRTYPSLLLLNASDGMVTFLSWGGLWAALLLVLNIWPRAMLGMSLVFFVSLSCRMGALPQPIQDPCLVEATFLAIFLAPSGSRPGLGASSPPHPLALTALRFLAFRVMFESGMAKLLSGDESWRNFTAMDRMYLTGMFPSVFGYYLHQMPHWWHVLEQCFTFVVELGAPLLALVGRRARVVAVLLWTVFQLVISVAANFGFLNAVAIVVGIMLLDDRTPDGFQRRLPVERAERLRGWRGGVFFGLLGAHFTLAVVRLVMFLGVPASVVPGVLLAPVAFIQNMMLVNVYAPFGVMIDRREQIEFEGSDDGGRTWKRYPYRHTFADPARMPSVVSPYMPRFEGMMFLLGRFAGTQRNDAVVTTGALLTEGAPDVTRLFESNPFPDRPPDQMRFVLYRIEFNSLEQKQATGHYWERTYVSEYLPGLQRDPETQLLRQLPPVR